MWGVPSFCAIWNFNLANRPPVSDRAPLETAMSGPLIGIKKLADIVLAAAQVYSIDIGPVGTTQLQELRDAQREASPPPT